MFFTRFASENELHGFIISGRFVLNDYMNQIPQVSILLLERKLAKELYRKGFTKRIFKFISNSRSIELRFLLFFLFPTSPTLETSPGSSSPRELLLTEVSPCEFLSNLFSNMEKNKPL